MPTPNRKPSAKPAASRSSSPRSTGARPRKKKKSTATSRSFLFIVAILAAFAFLFNYINNGSPLETPPSNTIPIPEGAELRVYFLDVGQGDSILLQTSEHSVLIDAGEYSAREALLSYLRDAGVTTIDYLVATHPHADHIGGMVPVLKNFTVKEALMPDVVADTTTFEDFVTLLDEQKIPVTFPSPGDVIEAGLINLEVLAPLSDYSDDPNNASLVLRMQYGSTSFLFTGDVERPSEQDMLEAGRNLSASILKAGHHGSDTASSEEFLDAVMPSAVVISVGRLNSYGHPHEEMLERLAARGIPVYRTDESGTVIMRTDGQKVELISGE